MSLALDYMLNDIMVLADNRIEVWKGINKLASAFGSDLTEDERVDRAVNEIVEYQNRILRFEEMNTSVSAPNKYIVERVTINTDSLVRKYEVGELISLLQDLNDYSINVSNFTEKILDAKDNISAIWRDSQYNLFSDFIDDICVEITNALKKFDEYAAYLDEKVKELS